MLIPDVVCVRYQRAQGDHQRHVRGARDPAGAGQLERAQASDGMRGDDP